MCCPGILKAVSFKREQLINFYNKLVLPPIAKETLPFSLHQAQCKLKYSRKKRTYRLTT